MRANDQLAMHCNDGKTKTCRNPSHIYELRSYHLKPGTMVEWGNYWSKAIKLRDYKNEEAYMGLFSQIGDLYKVKVRPEQCRA